MKKIALTAALLLVVPFHSAYAYLDPGTGSMIVQLLLGAIAGAFVTFRLMRDRIAAMFRRTPKNGDEPKQQ